MAGVVYAHDNVMTRKAGDYTVTASFDKTPPVTGDNTFFITIRDAAGKSITDATVGVHYYMTEKGGPNGKYVEMLSMGAKAVAEAKNAGYKADLNFSMAGPWNIKVKITRAGKEETAKFHVVLK